MGKCWDGKSCWANISTYSVREFPLHYKNCEKTVSVSFCHSPCDLCFIFFQHIGLGGGLVYFAINRDTLISLKRANPVREIFANRHRANGLKIIFNTEDNDRVAQFLERYIG